MRVSRNAKRNLIVAGIVALMVAGALSAGYYVTKKLIIKNYAGRLDALDEEIREATHNVFVADRDIGAGEEITRDKLRVEKQLVTQASGLFGEDSLGTFALVDIPKDAVLYTAYASGREEGGSSRLVEYTCMYLSATLAKGDYVDVRIRYQNGEDFSLLSKKRVEEISIAAKSCHMALDGDEMQEMSSAIIDANEFDAVIYCVEYTAPTLQEPTEVTYPPRPETLAVLFPEEGEEYLGWMRKRGELEERLLAYGEEVSRPPVDISNFTNERGKEQSNTNDTGVTSTPAGEYVEPEDGQ